LLLQLAAHQAEELPAYALGGAVSMWHRFGPEPDLCVVGEPEAAAELTRLALPEGPGESAASVPEAAAARLAEEHGWEVVDGWAFRWTAEEPSPPPINDGAGWLPPEADDEVRALLAEAFPDASMPVGHPDVRRWAGLRRDGRLLACAADTTVAEGLGFLASITRRQDVRGTGSGAAISAWATAALVREHGRCGLWHMRDNAVAAGLYTRLGYRDDHRMLVVTPPKTG
jgi:GNAT superfamily N-acetyltransferase